MTTPEREKFEKWAVSENYDVTRSHAGNFESLATQMAEQGWQAALSAAPTPLDSGCGVTEEWELPTTPPGVEPVDAVLLDDMDSGFDRRYGRVLIATENSITQVYLRPPSPKADEVDALKAEIARLTAYSEKLSRRLGLCVELKTNHKAEYGAEGNPLNLLAAANKFCSWFSGDHLPCRAGDFDRDLSNLRKFIGDSE